MSADASCGLLCFLERGFKRDFLEETLRLETGVLEGLEAGLAPPPEGSNMWTPPVK